MADLIDTTEMYLRTILELEEEGITPLRARISERLGHSGPTVSQTVNRMERLGLVVVTEDRRLELTEEGRTKAVQVMRKHRLAERLLADVIGLDWEYVHDEACRWEHVMSERVERRLLDILGHPTVSPYGNPIPGLEELGARGVIHTSRGAASVTERLPLNGSQVTAQVVRLAEPAQVDPELLAEFLRAGVTPGNQATFTRDGDFVRIEGAVSGEVLELTLDAASHIFITEGADSFR